MKSSMFNIFLGFILIAGVANISYSLPSCVGTATSNECANSDLNGTSCNYYSTSSATEISNTTCTYHCTDGCKYCSCGHSDCSGSGSPGAPCNTCTTVTSTTYQGTQCGAGGTSGTCEGSGGCEYTVG